MFHSHIRRGGLDGIWGEAIVAGRGRRPHQGLLDDARQQVHAEQHRRLPQVVPLPLQPPQRRRQPLRLRVPVDGFHHLQPGRRVWSAMWHTVTLPAGRWGTPAAPLHHARFGAWRVAAPTSRLMSRRSDLDWHTRVSQRLQRCGRGQHRQCGSQHLRRAAVVVAQSAALRPCRAAKQDHLHTDNLPVAPRSRLPRGKPVNTDATWPLLQGHGGCKARRRPPCDCGG